MIETGGVDVRDMNVEGGGDCVMMFKLAAEEGEAR